MLTDDVDENIMQAYKIPNEGDEERIFHTYDKWECHKAGFYASKKEGMTAEECETAYANFLRDPYLFSDTLAKLTIEWKHSCEHYLTNKSMNRVAWLGQAAMCYYSGIPSRFCSGFNLLSIEEQTKANLVALDHLNKWLTRNGFSEVSIEDATLIGRQTELY